MAISPQTPDESRRAADDFGVHFPLLADRANETARDYGLVYRCPDRMKEIFLEVLETDLAEYNGDDSWTLPMPARYVVDGDGIVRWASVSPDYTRRPDPEETLQALEEPGES